VAALGIAAGVFLAVFGLPYGRLDYNAYAHLYGTQSAGQHLSIDAIPDGTCATIDGANSVSVSSSTTVDVCLENSASDVGFFQLNVDYDDGVLDAPEIDPGDTDATGRNDNPDFDETTVAIAAGTGWNCTGGGSGYPRGDNNTGSGVDHNFPSGVYVPFTGGVASGGQAFITCSGTTNFNFTTGETGRLASITFDTRSTVGSSTLVFSGVQIADSGGTETGSCPTITTAMPCDPGTITLTTPPSATPTATATNTHTPTNTPTPTATPSGPIVNKVCVNSQGDSDPDDTNCQLFIQKPQPSLQVDEVADNFTNLGAYEFQIKFNHKLLTIAVTDHIFFHGAGAARGPADCSMSIVTENWILFGCVTTGAAPPGPNAPPAAVLAHLFITPNDDLKFRITPGNDNGTNTDVLDENCELADVLGHPMPGTVQIPGDPVVGPKGGLALECGDIHITIRILEGDVDLDCDVDADDAQAIAARYGSSFGILLYDPWFDLEPNVKDFDIDIKDVQKVFGRIGSTCDDPIPPQEPKPPVQDP
jgi:hypothetical protein